MAELAIALVLKTRDRKVMGDRDPLSPPFKAKISRLVFGAVEQISSSHACHACYPSATLGSSVKTDSADFGYHFDVYLI